jgi:hypothetical protein
MTFDSLMQTLDDYVERGSVSDAAYLRQKPEIINRSERSLADKLKVQGYLDVLSSSLSQGVCMYAKPDGWRDTVSWRIGTGSISQPDVLSVSRFLRERSFEVVNLYAPDRTQMGQPEWYADYDLEHWIVLPTPDMAYPMEVIIHRLPPLLCDSNQQNYLTQLTPNLLLYECLTHMEPFLKSDSRLVTWEHLRDEELQNIDTQEIGKFIDRTLSRKIP